MSSNTEKFLGYILLLVGLICILYAFFSLYNAFTGAVKPPDLFQMQKLQFSVSPVGNSQSMVVSAPLDSEARKVVNLFLYYLFMFFIVMAGGTISSLGIQCIKEIKAVVKNQN